MTRIFMHGVYGRMGSAIVEMCSHDPSVEIVAGADIFSPEKPKYDFPVYTNVSECEEDFDVIIDFSTATAVPAVVEFAASMKKPIVICTTALTDDTNRLILDSSKKIPIFKSANMSYGMNVVFELVKEATKLLYPNVDIEIVEAHHNRKIDAPSGTAMAIADIIAEETNNELEYTYERHSVSKPRGKKELGISSIRGGNIVGEHEVMFIAEEEIVKISHSAQNRTVFARGAIMAASFLVGKEPGFYSMSDVVSEALQSK